MLEKPMALEIPGCTYGHDVVPCEPEPDNEALSESDSDNDEIMGLYADQVQTPLDTTKIRFLCGNTNFRKNDY